MSGRDSFVRYKLVIDILVKIIRVIPDFFISPFLLVLESSESKGALLLRYLYIRKKSKACGDNVFIGKSVTIKNLQKLEIGSNVSIHAYCYLDAAGGLKIGDNVSIANHTSIISFEHGWEDYDKPIKYNPTVQKQVVIEDDVWIGSGCRILAGINISTRSIVAAGAVVTKDVELASIVGGVPAKLIKKIDKEVIL